MTDLSEKQWDDLQALAMSASASDLRTKCCPSCGAPLRFLYTSTGNRSSVQVSCVKCFSRINLDGNFREAPPWVAQVGNTLLTEAPNAA